MIDRDTLWIVMIGLAVGSFALRFAFTGFVGDRDMPKWLLRHLRYTAVAILPALVAPMVLWPQATQGAADLPRSIAAIVTLGVGYFTKSMLPAIFSGAIALYSGLYLLG